MILTCPNCGTSYQIPDGSISDAGRTVRCANCEQSWFQLLPGDEAANAPASTGVVHEESLEMTPPEPAPAPLASPRRAAPAEAELAGPRLAHGAAGYPRADAERSARAPRSAYADDLHQRPRRRRGGALRIILILLTLLAALAVAALATGIVPVRWVGGKGEAPSASAPEPAETDVAFPLPTEEIESADAVPPAGGQ